MVPGAKWVCCDSSTNLEKATALIAWGTEAGPQVIYSNHRVELSESPEEKAIAGRVRQLWILKWESEPSALLWLQQSMCHLLIKWTNTPQTISITVDV